LITSLAVSSIYIDKHAYAKPPAPEPDFKELLSGLRTPKDVKISAVDREWIKENNRSLNVTLNHQVYLEEQLAQGATGFLHDVPDTTPWTARAMDALGMPREQWAVTVGGRLIELETDVALRSAGRGEKTFLEIGARFVEAGRDLVTYVAPVLAIGKKILNVIWGA
ncbi:MAG: hypothetical protein WCK42_07300, partial [Myxococcaceae bacterium]